MVWRNTCLNASFRKRCRIPFVWVLAVRFLLPVVYMLRLRYLLKPPRVTPVPNSLVHRVVELLRFWGVEFDVLGSWGLESV